MRRFEFTEEEREVIARERFEHPNPRAQRRMEILWLKLHEERHERIAELTGIGRRTVRRVLDAFARGRWEAVRSFGERGRTSSLQPHGEWLEREFRCDRIHQLTGVRRRPTQVRSVLRERLGLSWRKVAAVPVFPNKSVEEPTATQAAFLKDRA
jgi:transposase